MQFYPRASDYEQLRSMAVELAVIVCRIKDATGMSPEYVDRANLRGVYTDAKQAKVISESVAKFMETFKEL